jgi:hypothetical protein
LLVSNAVAGWDKWSEPFYSFTVSKEIPLDMFIDTWPVMVPMFFGDENKCQCASKCLFEFSTSYSLDSSALGDNRKPVCCDNTNKGSNKGNATTNDCEPVGIYFDGSLLEFCGWIFLGAFGGIVIALFFLFLFYKYKLKIL